MAADLLILAIWISLVLMLVETFRVSKPLIPGPTKATVHIPVTVYDGRASITAANTGRRRRGYRVVLVPKWIRSRAWGTSHRHVHNVPMQAAAAGVVLPKSTSVKLDARKLGGLEGTNEYGVPGGSGWNN